MTDQPRTTGIRERNRREITAEILDLARSQLSEGGVPGLSLRSISRSMGMASSAIYRYFASRDELLTALIIEAYQDLALEAARGDESVVDRESYGVRWLQICDSMRAWALRDPQRWGLIYGTPVTGYNAPQDTVESARSVSEPLLLLAADVARASGRSESTGVSPLLGPEVMSGYQLGEDDGMESIAAWSHLLGLISLEVFGHLDNVVLDRDGHFRSQMLRWAELFNISG